MGLATLLCWSALGVIILNIDPYVATAGQMVFFYISLFLALVGTLSIFLFFVQSSLSRKGLPMYRYVQKSFSTSTVITAVLILLLFLQSKSLLTLINLVLFIGLITVLTAFIFSLKGTQAMTHD